MQDEREKYLPSYLKWLSSVGVESPKIEIHRVGDFNMAIRAKADILDGDLVVKVPLSVAINKPNILAKYPQLGRFDPIAIGADQWALIYLFIATERHKPESSYAPMFTMIPLVIHTPVSYTPDEFALLESTNLHAAVTKIRAKLAALLAYYPTLQKEFPEVYNVDIAMDDLVWAYEVFWSRAFAVMVDGEQLPSLLPMCGMFNHSPDAHVTYVTDTEKGFFGIQSNSAVFEGMEFYNNYRHRSNEKLMLNYGFICEDNVLDCFTLKVNVAEGDPLLDRKKALLKEAKIDWEQYLVKDDDPVTPSLYECLRILSLDDREMYLLGDRQPNTVVSPRNEAEMLHTLSKLLEKQYERLKFKDVAADKALAQQYKDAGEYAKYCCVYYRIGQAQILKHALDHVRAKYDAYVSSLNWQPVFHTFPTANEHLEAFVSGANATGIFHGVTYVKNETGEVRMVATQDIAPGDLIVSFPRQTIMIAEDEATLAVGLAQSEAVRFIAFPRSFFSPAMLSAEELAVYLSGTDLQSEAVEMSETIAQDCADVEESGVDPEQFVWARACCESHIVPISGYPSLIPLPFLPRHSPYHRLDKEYCAESDAFHIRTTYTIKKGEEVFDFCGSNSSGDHLLRFGFLLEENPLDTLHLNVDAEKLSACMGQEELDPNDAMESLFGGEEEDLLMLNGDVPKPLVEKLGKTHFLALVDMLRAILCADEIPNEPLARYVQRHSEMLESYDKTLCGETDAKRARTE